LQNLASYLLVQVYFKPHRPEAFIKFLLTGCHFGSLELFLPAPLLLEANIGISAAVTRTKGMCDYSLRHSSDKHQNSTRQNGAHPVLHSTYDTKKPPQSNEVV
jgi:hypothetical protein